MSSKIRHARQNLFSSVFSKVVGLFLPFALRSVMISTIGVEYLGLTGLFQSVFSFLNLTELGLSSAIVYLLYKPVATGDVESVCSLLRFLRSFYKVVGTVILCVGLLLIPFLPHLIRGQAPDDIRLTVVYLILLCDTVAGYFFFAYMEVLFTASQRVDLLNYVGLGVRILTTVLQIIVLLCYQNFYLYCLVIPALTILRSLVIAWLSRREYPEYVCRGTLSSSQKSTLRRLTAGLMIGQVSGRFTYDLDNIVISAFLGLTLLGKYQNYALISLQLTSFVALFASSLLPGIGNAMAMESRQTNYQEMNVYQLLYMWMNGWITVCLICMYQPFIQLWLGKEMLLPDSLLPVFGLYYISAKMNDVCFQYRTAAGLWWEERYRAIFAGLFNLVMDLVLVKMIGIAGVMLGTILYQFLFDSFWGDAILFKNCFPEYNRSDYMRRRVLYVSVTVLACAVCWYVCKAFPSVDGRNGRAVFMLLLRGLICTVAANGILWTAYHRLPEYRPAVSLVRRLLRRRA